MDEPADPRELGRVTAAKRCRTTWTQMHGEGCARRCPRCQQKVYDVSTLTALEARALIMSEEGALRVRFFRRADGTLLARECSVGAQAAANRALAVSLFAAVSIAVAVVVGAFTCDDAERGPSAPVPLRCALEANSGERRCFVSR